MTFQLTYRNNATGDRRVLKIYVRDVDYAKADAQKQLGDGWEFVTVTIL